VFRRGLWRRGWWRRGLWRHSGHDQNATARLRWTRQGRQPRGPAWAGRRTSAAPGRGSWSPAGPSLARCSPALPCRDGWAP